ncbi:coenzyme F420-0:L-glutamate ligase [Ornithinimicrobium tianjinense]|uniref:F420-0--gamma-glutamyl ligase n=1 Tax=Ornithinimicrobium tianjinense TaxID=1195761 RepID=A0A917BG36_9MICO|nr:coenzyme F420-0:L-glutamate ligase [Ornithinimicrobium tianjinense]GGF42959.1 F420-0--gamma-glutamyl ligase [Ornithinimicrobium tianjinense]
MSRPDGVVELVPLRGVPEVRAGDDLAALLLTALRPVGGLRDGDVLVVSSKVLSKALGLREPVDGAAREALVLRHSRRVVAERRTGSGTTRIVEAQAGPVMAAAGLDASNTGPDAGVLVLPADPDAAAADLHAALADRAPDVTFAVLVSDTAGRPWRSGQTDLALGSHALRVLDDLRAGTDADGRPLAVTARALADEIAAAADLVKGKVDGVPAALVRGLPEVVDPGTTEDARSLVRTGPGDWFALGHVEAVRAALGAAPGTEEAESVGIPSVGPEEPRDRGERAVRLALLGHPGARVAGTVSSGYAVSAADPVLAGRVAARLEVALAGEGQTSSVTVEPDGSSSGG